MISAYFASESKLIKKGVILLSPLIISLYCIPAFSKDVEFGIFYCLSSISFFAAFYLSTKIKIGVATEFIAAKKFALYAARVFGSLYIIFLAPFSLYKLMLVVLGSATSLYTVTNKLQVAGDTSFVSRVFTANMPLGLSIGIIFASLFLVSLPSIHLIYKFDFLIFYGALFTAILYLMSAGNLSPIVAILQMVAFAFIPIVYSGASRAFRQLKFQKLLLRKFIVFSASFLVLLLALNYYSQLKDLDGISDVLFSYIKQVFDYQRTIYLYVNNEGVSNSGGLASLFPVNILELDSNSLSKFKAHLDPVLLKGLWFGMTGRQLLEFGPFIQPFIMFTSSLFYFMVLYIASKLLLPPQYSTITWYFLSFCMITAIWTSDPMTGIPIPLFTILSIALITQLIPEPV